MRGVSYKSNGLPIIYQPELTPLGRADTLGAPSGERVPSTRDCRAHRHPSGYGGCQNHANADPHLFAA